jgi:selenocysteine-specific elongation factor
LKARAVEVLRQRHQNIPFAYGYNESEWREQVEAPEPLFKALLANWLEQGAVRAKDGRYHLPGFEPELPSSWKTEAQILEKLVLDAGMSPPLRTELEAKGAHARDIMNFWFSTGRMVSLSEGVLYPRQVFDDAVARIRAFCQAKGSITVAQVRDLLGTSRKYVVPLLVYTDELGLTRREGDLRYWAGEETG